MSERTVEIFIRDRGRKMDADEINHLIWLLRDNERDLWTEIERLNTEVAVEKRTPESWLRTHRR